MKAELDEFEKSEQNPAKFFLMMKHWFEHIEDTLCFLIICQN